jgi:two-component system response regulator HydG
MGAIARLNGDKLMAAKLLGIGKTTLYRKLKEYGSDL